MKQPIVIEKFSDNGQLSHYELVNADTGEVFWTEEHKYDYEQAVRKIVADELGTTLDAITVNSSFKDLGADKLNLIQIITYIEDEFQTVFVNSEIDRIKTVKDILDHLERVC